MKTNQELYSELKGISTRLISIIENLEHNLSKITPIKGDDFVEAFLSGKTTSKEDIQPPREKERVQVTILGLMKRNPQYPGQYYSGRIGDSATQSFLGYGEFASFKIGDVIETDVEEKTARNGSTYMYMTNCVLVEKIESK